MVVNADFTLLNCFADGRSAVAREIKLPTHLFDDQRTTCIGSLDDWIVCVYPRTWNARQSVLLSDQYCYLLAPSKQKIVHLPDPPAFQTTQRLHGLIQVENGNGAISYTQPLSAFNISLSKAILTTEPDMGNCKVAAMSDRRGRHHLALCTVGMSCWCLFTADFITVGTDLEFYEGSLYLLVNDSADLYILNFGPDFCLFLVVTHAERCLIEQLPSISDNGVHSCSLVKLNQKLLLVVRQFPDLSEQMTGVDVYMLDNKSKPWKWVTANSLNGQCILISSSYNKSYPAHLYDEIEEETIYFLDSMNPGYLPREDENFTYQVLVYNVKDKMIGIRHIGSKPAGPSCKFPMWFCPTE
ncbi:unnamed protein product [Urochloa decumbens]|uniref:KIB1-4 beta-propeller domain-containing protein n=1 Tax=Urochloa decumbens TaxID=240449 RepID=A0ABC8YX98_9POAL